MYLYLKKLNYNYDWRYVMYNLANLNDYEFEILCKDIMESKLSIQLHRFAKG